MGLNSKLNTTVDNSFYVFYTTVLKMSLGGQNMLWN